MCMLIHNRNMHREDVVLEAPTEAAACARSNYLMTTNVITSWYR